MTDRTDDPELWWKGFSPSEFQTFVESFSFEVMEQPYSPQPLFGSSRYGERLMRPATRYYRGERWAARIDFVARKSAARSKV